MIVSQKKFENKYLLDINQTATESRVLGSNHIEYEMQSTFIVSNGSLDKHTLCVWHTWMNTYHENYLRSIMFGKGALSSHFCWRGLSLLPA